MTNLIDNETQQVTNIQLSNFVIVDKDGDGFDPCDILREGEQAQGKGDEAKAAAESFNSHLVLLAQKCGKPEILGAVLDMAEEKLMWGTAPKGSPAHIRNQYHPMPALYRNYKSKLLSAMKRGVIPGAEQTLTRKLSKPNKQGQTEVKEIVKLDTVRKMERAANELFPKEVEQSQPVDGVIVDAHGEQHFSVADAKTYAGLIDLELGAAISLVVDLYEHAPTADKEKAIKALNQLAKRLEKVQPEVLDAAQAVNA